MNRINIDEPRWDQNVYSGRLRHFFAITNPMNIFCSTETLEKAQDVVLSYRNGDDLKISEDELWNYKHIYDATYHPESGELMKTIGRMSAQVPMNMLITGGMLTFYRSTSGVVFWQTLNQSFNAIVNHTNRSGTIPISKFTIRASYFMAVTGAVATGVGLNSLVKKMPPLVGRLVPFVAVAAANCLNIPMMRRREWSTIGVPMMNSDGQYLNIYSTAAGKVALFKVVISRIIMASPACVFPPIIMNILEKRGVLRKMPFISAPLQIALCGLMLTFATPACCALFPQKASIRVDQCEESVQRACRKLPNPPTVLYYNKGL